MSLLVNRYAEALSDAATEENCLEEVYAEFAELYRNLKADAEFERLVTGDLLSLKEKEELLSKVFADGDPYFRGFLVMLSERAHLDEIKDIFLAFEEIYKKKKNIMDVEAVTAVPLPEELREKLVSGLTARYKKNIVLHEKVDPSILGGAVLYVGHEMLDASLKTGFDGLRDHLKKTEFE